jgi:hypothetical protein
VSKPDSAEQKLIAEREAALYDPDSRFRDHAAEIAAARSQAQTPRSETQPTGGGGIFAKGERRRAGAPMTAEMIKRIADRAEEAARRKGR